MTDRSLRPVHCTLFTVHRSGFTLIELVFVAIVLGVVTVSIMPRFQSRWQRLQEERSAFAVAQSLRAARSLAVSRSQPMAWVLDAEAGRMWIEQDDGSAKRVAGRLGSSKRLPEAVTIQAVQDDKSVERIRFFPDGTTEATTLLIGTAQQPHYRIAVDAVTGQVTIASAIPPTTS
jgi:prepilin-type N-terminal cleavage/methylation domain-containing protein